MEYSVNNKELAELSLGNEEDRIIHVAGIIPGDIVITVKAGFTIEGEADVYENGGRYSGNCATWYGVQSCLCEKFAIV